MAISKNAVAGGVAALGGTGAVAGVVIANQNKETIEEKFKEITRLPKTNTNELWRARISNSDQDEEIKELFKEKTAEAEKISALQQWCESKLSEKTTEELSKKFQKFCTYTIKEKMGAWALSTADQSNPNEVEYKELVIKHKDNNETEQKLKDIKTQDESTAWITLKSWCEEQYNKGYEGENELWNLVNKFCKKPTIQDKLKGTELSQEIISLDTEWTTKANTAASSAKEDALKEDLKTEVKKDKLKKWCSNQYTKAYDSKVDKKDSENLLDEVQKHCALKISEKIASGKKFENWENDEARWTSNVNALKTYTSTTGKPTLTKELTKIANLAEDNNDSKKKTQLKAWCKDAYEQGYKGENDDLWKLVKEFCYKA